MPRIFVSLIDIFFKILELGSFIDRRSGVKDGTQDHTINRKLGFSRAESLDLVEELTAVKEVVLIAGFNRPPASPYISRKLQWLRKLIGTITARAERRVPKRKSFLRTPASSPKSSATPKKTFTKRLKPSN
jgi:hypothetical protein